MSFCSPTPGALRTGEKALLLAVALLAAGAAWAGMLALHGGGGSISGHPHAHALAAPAGAAAKSASSFAALSAMWTLMMAGMMLPPVLPWILFYAAASRPAPEAPVSLTRTTVFTTGYLAVWSAFGVAAAAAESALAGAGYLGGADSRLAVKVAAGIVLMAAGIYQFTPLKDACLRHCRSPLTYFIQKWRNGPAGAFSMGARHGFYCMGCCWALMLVSFAVGVMNLAWMAALTVMLCIEKIAPGGDKAGKIFGGGLVFWGAFVIYLGLR